MTDDEAAFCRGYAAALEDLSGTHSMIRTNVVWRGPEEAAMRAHDDPGWLDRLVEEQTGLKSPKLVVVPKQGTVYVMLDAARKLVKIGWTSRDVAQRKKELEAGFGKPLTVLAVMPGTMRDESEVHSYFGDLRAFGEWFHAEPRILAWFA